MEDYQDQIASFICNEDCLKHDIEDITLLPTIPKPTSFRDAYAFRQHVETSRKNRGVDMIAEFDEFPVFYFSNHNAMFADGEEIELMPDHFEKLDYELEFAIVIGKGGKNILCKDADNHIAGFFILNDISARTLQMKEMKMNLGPAKGKDFANIIGPYLVTPDELESKSIHTPFGKKYDLNMKCFINGELLSEGNAKDMNWTFAEIIERASYGVELFAGDVIGSGTVGTGCLLELNGTGKRENPNYESMWIQDGDEIEMQIDGLGKITNKIVKSDTNHSLLKLKK
jgi:fumarylacetoacetate (FAA) hydrolase